MKRLIITLITCLLSLPIFALADTTTSSAAFNSSQKKAIEKIVHDYLVNNPQVLYEASQALQEKERNRAMQKAQKAVFSNAENLFNSENGQVSGNPNGNVTLVEFFDFQCGYCKQVAPLVQKFIANDKNLRVVFKEFPIFGETSEFAAKAAIASQKQNKYLAFHDALIKVKEELNENIVLSTAKSVGIDVNQLQRDIETKEVQQQLETNIQLAEQLGLRGTPAFIVAANPFGKNKKFYFVPGVPSEAMLKNMIQSARKSA